MGFLNELEDKHSQETPKKEDPAKPASSIGFLGELESKHSGEVASAPSSFLGELEQKNDTDPTSLRERKSRGEPLSTEQERVVFDADRARSAGEQASAIGKGVFTSLSEMVPQAFEGTKKIIGASKDLTKQIGIKYLDLNPIVPEIAVNYIAGNTAEERKAELEKAAKKEADVVRSAASGAVQAGEEVINEAARGAFFGTPLTDLIQEYPAGKFAFEAMKAGGPVALASEALSGKIFGEPLVDVQPITKDESFQRSLNRESMRQQEQQEYKDLPERTTAALVKLAESSAGSLLGKSLGVPSDEQFQKDLVQELKNNAIVPDKDIAMIGNMLSPLDPTFVLAGPLARASSKAFDLASQAGLRALTKPTIAGVNPLEGLGKVIRFGGEGTQKAARKLSDFLTGSEDSFIGKLADPVVAVTRRPGMIVEGAGRALRDIGRQIDDVGIRSRTGIIERAGQDVRSGDFMRTVFGPGTEKAQAKALKAAEKLAGEGEEMGAAAPASISKRRAAARTADWVFRQAEAVARYGTSGAAIGTALGLPDIENAEMLGQVATTGAMVGTIGAARLGEKGAKLVDPRVSLKGKIDAILADDPVSRRADEDADIERFRNTASPDIINKADEFGNINSVLQSFDGHIQNLVDQRNQAIARGENDVAAGMDLEIKKTSDSKDAVSKMTPDAMKEYQRRVDLTLADALDQAKTTGEAVGLNNIEIKLLSPVEMLGHLRDKWGTTLTNAEYVLQSLAGNNDLSDADQQKLNQATETINQFNSMYQTAMGQRGYAMSDNTYSDSPMHLRPANLKTPSVVINSELVKSQLGNNLYATLTHEVNHALRNFKEVKSMMAPLEEYLFGRKVQNADGSITEISKGIYDDAAIDRMGDYYAELLGGDKWKAGFATEGQFRNYIKEEILSEAAGLSSNTANLRADLDSPGQAFVDWAATSNKNTLIGKLRDALGLKGVLLDDTGRISDILGETISPEVLALTRQFQRQLRDYNGSLSQVTSATGPEVTISAPELLSSKILQNKYRGLDIWQKEQVLTIKDDEGNVVNEIVVPKSASLDPLVGQYRLEDGMLVDENGNKMQIAPEIAAANLPNNTNISVDQRIARNPDGSPKILSNQEIQARARKRGEVLKNAIEGATEDGSTNRVRPVGDNEYAGILSPTQLQAILALPNDIVAPELKRKIAAFNETALRKDGTRMIVEYQAAMKGGKYKALAPKIRDVVPFGFRITKDGNFLATTISVSRIFDKINDWAKPNRNRLNLWNGDTNALWEDILHVLKNHQKGERGEVGLDVDPAMAMLKKNRINDIFNLFDKATESKNPDRSVSKTRKGQDSIDRVIMGMRMDRVNDFQISNAQKLPVDYGKIKENYMPNVPVDVVQNNVAEEGGLGYKESPTIKYREPKYETTNPPRLGYIDPRTTEEGRRVLSESPILAQAYDALERASEAGGDQRPTSGSSVIPAETEALREFANRSGAMESPEAVQKFTDDWNAENRTAGTEHQVLFGDKDRIEKRFTATYNDTWKNYLDRILLHNILFKDSAVKLEGFQEVPEITQDRNGQEWSPGLYAKISQPYAEGQQVDLIKDLKPYMESLGFVSNGPMNYYHPEYGVHVSDLHPGNAYVETDAQGNKHVTVFDPNLHLTGEKEGDAKERARVEAKLATQRPAEDVGFSWPKEVDDAIVRMKSVLENPDNMPTQVKPEAPLPVSLYEAGTSLESFGLNSLKEIAEHYGFPVPEKAKRGEIIDLVENRSSDVQFMPSSKLDEAHAKAIESGDIEEAQRLVDEKAREAFPKTLAIIPPTSSKQDISEQPLKILYHGTGSDFTEFKSGLPTADDWGLFGNIPTERHAIFFAEEKDFANEFAKARDSKRVIPAYINAKKPLVFDDAFDKYDELMDLKDPTDEQKEDRQTYRYIWNLRDKWEAFDGESGKEFVDWMRRKGYDSAILSETGYGLEGEPTQDVWAVLDPSQIKSADPATYDDEGKLIPLSERFNTRSNDIRYKPSKKIEGAEGIEIAPGFQKAPTKGGKWAVYASNDLLATGKQFDTPEAADEAAKVIADANEPLQGIPYSLQEGRTGKWKILDKKGEAAASKTFSDPAEAADYAVALHRESLPLSAVKKFMLKADRDAVTEAEQRIADIQAKNPEAMPLVVARDGDTGLPKIDLLEDAEGNPILDDKGKQARGVIYRQVPYRLRQSPMLDAKDDNVAVQQAADLMTPEVQIAMADPSVAKAIGWYKKMRQQLQQYYGANIELFGQLLGATSARTQVDENFKQTIEAARQYSKGAYDALLQEFHEHIVKATEDLASGALQERWEKKNPTKTWNQEKDGTDALRMEINKFSDVPLRSNGKKFNANSQKVLHALYGNWLSQTVGPKTPNFAGNLTGRTLRATIDVWAARNLRRLLYDDGTSQWRLLPEQEKGVDSAYNAKGELTGDFPFAQNVYDVVASRVNMNADDLQALMWFYEKGIWDQNGWTGALGAKKSSFEEEAEKLSLDRYQAGVTAYTNEGDYPNLKEFTAGVQEKTRKELRDSIGQLPGVEISRVTHTDGLYGGSVEPSLDVEFSVSRDKSGKPQSIASVIDRLKAIGKEQNQYDTFISQLVDKEHPNARPMVEVGFKNAAKPEEVDAVVKAFRDAGIDGFTLAKDSKGNVIGIRAQYIPEISSRWDEDGRVDLLDPEKHGESSQNWAYKARQAINSLGDQENVSYKNEGHVSTHVYGKEEYDAETSPQDLLGSDVRDQLGRRKRILEALAGEGQVSGGVGSN